MAPDDDAPEYPHWHGERRKDEPWPTPAEKRMLGVLWEEHEVERAAEYAREQRRAERLAHQKKTLKALGWILFGALVTSAAPPWWVTGAWSLMKRGWKSLIGAIT